VSDIGLREMCWKAVGSLVGESGIALAGILNMGASTPAGAQSVPSSGGLTLTRLPFSKLSAALNVHIILLLRSREGAIVMSMLRHVRRE